MEHTGTEYSFSAQTKEDAIISIIDEYGEQIKRLIFTYVKNYAQTDDIFQDFLINVYQKLEQFNGNSSLKTWLYRIAINKCKDYLRSPIRRVFQIIDKEDFTGKTAESAESELMQKQRYEQLAQLVLSMPIKYREIFILRYYQDFSIKEISITLGIGESTVRTRIMRGKDKLRDIIGGDYFEEL